MYRCSEAFDTLLAVLWWLARRSFMVAGSAHQIPRSVDQIHFLKLVADDIYECAADEMSLLSPLIATDSINHPVLHCLCKNSAVIITVVILQKQCSYHNCIVLAKHNADVITA